MIIKNIRTIKDYPKSKNNNDKSPLIHLINELISHEMHFGLNKPIKLEQTIRHSNSRYIGRFFNIIKKLELLGYIEIVSINFKHERPTYIKDDTEWDSIDKKVQYFAKKGKIVII